MRPSAEIGSENSTRSTRVRRANSTRSSTVPSFGKPAADVRRAVVAAVVEHADQAHVGVLLRARARRPAFRRARRRRRSRCGGRAGLRGSSAAPCRRAPGARRRARAGRCRRSWRARRANTCRRDCAKNKTATTDEKHQRPRDGELGAAGSPGCGRPGCDRCRRPGTRGRRAPRCRTPCRCSRGRRSAVLRIDVGEIDDDADQRDQRELGDAHDAGDHDRRYASMVGCAATISASGESCAAWRALGCREAALALDGGVHHLLGIESSSATHPHMRDRTRPMQSG